MANICSVERERSIALLTLGKSCGMTPNSFRSCQEMRISLERSELTRASMCVLGPRRPSSQTTAAEKVVARLLSILSPSLAL